MANKYKDVKGHWTSKENDGGPCHHEGGSSTNKNVYEDEKGNSIVKKDGKYHLTKDGKTSVHDSEDDAFDAFDENNEMELMIQDMQDEGFNPNDPRDVLSYLGGNLGYDREDQVNIMEQMGYSADDIEKLRNPEDDFDPDEEIDVYETLKNNMKADGVDLNDYPAVRNYLKEESTFDDDEIFDFMERLDSELLNEDAEKPMPDEGQSLSLGGKKFKVTKVDDDKIYAVDVNTGEERGWSKDFLNKQDFELEDTKDSQPTGEATSDEEWNKRHQDFLEKGKSTWNQKLQKGDKVTFEDRDGKPVEAYIGGFYKSGELVDEDAYEEGKDNNWHDFRGVNLVDKDGKNLGNINAFQIKKHERPESAKEDYSELKDTLKKMTGKDFTDEMIQEVIKKAGPKSQPMKTPRNEDSVPGATKIDNLLKNSQKVANFGRNVLPNSAYYVDENGNSISAKFGSMDHEEINNDLGADLYNDYKMIALNPGVHGSNAASIDIPTGKKVSETEWEAIKNFIEGAAVNGRTVDFGNGPYDTKYYSAKDIYNQFRRFYYRGKK